MKQPNYWTCYPTAVSVATGIPLNVLLETLGHDGSTKISDEPDPICRAAFYATEITLALLKHGWCHLQIQAAPLGINNQPLVCYPPFAETFALIKRMQVPAILTVSKKADEICPKDRLHAMALLTTGEVHDPLVGEKISLESVPPIVYIEPLIKIGY